MRIDTSALPVDTSRPVAVTGATGYVAGWIVAGLLEAGVTVHATVRDPGDDAKVAHLRAIEREAPGTLKLFAADLLSEGSFAEALAGTSIVFHTASPFVRSVADPQRDLVDPALAGTRNVLESVNATASVERVVLTSSIAAMYGDAADLGADGIITENMWNTSSSLEREPYSYSKTLAEKAAWHVAGSQGRWRLVVINPGLVVGPALNSSPTSESFSIIRNYTNGTLRLGCPAVDLCMVDVRDVAYAHIAAAYLPDAEGRHLVTAEATNLFALAEHLRPRYGDSLPLPRRALPKRLAVAIAPFIGQSRSYFRMNIGHPLRFDASKSAKALGVAYRPTRESLEEMVAQVMG